MLLRKSNILNCLYLIFILFSILQLGKCEDKKPEEPKVKVSIIIPAYNAEKFIERSLGSALNQTLKEIEVIVVNDGSTDKTLEKILQFKDDKRLKIIDLRQNMGAGPARNIAIEAAVGEFLGFIDSDDVVDLRYFEFLYKYSKNYDMVAGIFVNSTNLSDKFSHHRPFQTYGCAGDSIWRRSFVNKYNIRFLPSHDVGEDIVFRKGVYAHKPRRFDAPDEGIYYYYKRREGSLMNYSNNYINNLNRTNTETGDSFTPYKDEDGGILSSIEKYLVPSVLVIGGVVIALIVVIIIALWLYKRSKYMKLVENNQA